ncbi:MAG: hypothetical protein QG670_2143 [Thermoproteota archaeon]|nr:hypothetical protein [Thermoproteota archaeon]
MKKMKVSLFLVSLLLLSLFAGFAVSIVKVNAASKLKIVIDISHGQGPTNGNWTGNKLQSLTADFEGNLTAKGYQVVWATQLSDSVLADAQFLFLGSVYGMNLTDSEVNTIVNWFRQGEKTIWFGSDSDFGGYRYIDDNANNILRLIGSKIRVEPTAVQDPISNCASAYRVRANVTNKQDAEVSTIISGVNATKGVLFHGPTILYGNVNGTSVPLETTKIRNVYWVMKTGASSTIVDSDPSISPPIIHTDGQTGSYVIMAVEKYAGPNGNSKIIVTGENPYGGYQPMFTSDYYNYPLDGAKLVMNTVSWGVKVEYQSDKATADTTNLITQMQSTITTLRSDMDSLRTLLYIAIVIAVVGVVVGVVVFMKKLGK